MTTTKSTTKAPTDRPPVDALQYEKLALSAFDLCHRQMCQLETLTTIASTLCRNPPITIDERHRHRIMLELLTHTGEEYQQQLAADLETVRRNRPRRKGRREQRAHGEASDPAPGKRNRDRNSTIGSNQNHAAQTFIGEMRGDREEGPCASPGRRPALNQLRRAAYRPLEKSPEKAVTQQSNPRRETTASPPPSHFRITPPSPQPQQSPAQHPPQPLDSKPLPHQKNHSLTSRNSLL